MNIYFLVPILCLGVPIGFWIFYTFGSLTKLLSWLALGLLAVSLGFIAIPVLSAWGDRWIKESASAALEPYVAGSIDSVLIGGRT